MAPCLIRATECHLPPTPWARLDREVPRPTREPLAQEGGRETRALASRQTNQTAWPCASFAGAGDASRAARARLDKHSAIRVASPAVQQTSGLRHIRNSKARGSERVPESSHGVQQGAGSKSVEAWRGEGATRVESARSHRPSRGVTRIRSLGSRSQQAAALGSPSGAAQRPLSRRRVARHPAAA
jgi:hypothetical protein